jgi:Tol biopolymer transport system component
MHNTRASLPSAAIAAALIITTASCDRAGEARAPRPPAADARPALPATSPAAAATKPSTEPARREDSLADVVQLTSGFERAGEAYFSPDAAWIIFQATPRGEQHYQMYVARLRRQGERITGIDPPVRISPAGSRNTCGFFSPDGRSILFASTAGKEDPGEPAAGYQRQGGNYRWDFPNGMEIYRADDWQAAVEGAGGGAVDLAKKAITRNDAYDAEGAYSPDGNWIVFGSRRDGDSELYAMRSDGSQPVRLTNAPGYDGGPFFSPHGQRVVYRSDRKGNDLLQIFTADLTFDGDGNVTGTTGERQLTDDANVNWGPYWHPDGGHIVYATSAHGHHNYELYWMNADGSGKTRITYAPGFDGLPVFSADGRYLMWSGKRTKDNTTQVFLARFTPPRP